MAAVHSQSRRAATAMCIAPLACLDTVPPDKGSEPLRTGHGRPAKSVCGRDPPETSIVVRGDCAIVLGDMRGEVKIGGQMRVLNSRSLAVWGRENDNWVLLAFQPTKYPS